MVNERSYVTTENGSGKGFREDPNPPPKVSCSSDYGLFRSPVACHSTMSPDCGCGIDQDDRADINPKPGVGSDLSH